jgi:hypothetical protein
LEVDGIGMAHAATGAGAAKAMTRAIRTDVNRRNIDEQLVASRALFKR